MPEQTVRRERQATFYEILQVSPTADPEVIHASYRVLARHYHPDLNSAPDAAARMRELNEAYDVLRDTQRRATYDVQRRRSVRPGAPRPRPTTTNAGAPRASSLRVVDGRPAASAGRMRVRLVLIVVVLMASLALALWLLIEVLMDTQWAVFLA